MANNAADKAALDRFVRWLGQQQGGRAAEVSYWVDAYLRGDGKDMYGRPLERR